MSQSRKDDHITLALEQKETSNRFDEMVIEHHSIPNIGMDDIDLSTTFLEYKIPYPFYINAMTGGSERAKEINKKLAQIAKHYQIPLILGSFSNALKDASLEHTYQVAREVYEDGFIVANVSANANLNQAIKACDMVSANALSIHVNVVQELSMAEGDRDFKSWRSNIKNIVNHIKVPVMIKEVGFGFSLEALNELVSLGVEYVDVSGKGGTNFADIELKRASKTDPFLSRIGIETVDALISASSVEKLEVYASGGIRYASDIVKSLILGAKAVGLSKYFLKRSLEPFDQAIKTIDALILDIKKIMCALNQSSIRDLRGVKYKVKSI